MRYYLYLWVEKFMLGQIKGEAAYKNYYPLNLNLAHTQSERHFKLCSPPFPLRLGDLYYENLEKFLIF